MPSNTPTTEQEQRWAKERHIYVAPVFPGRDEPGRVRWRWTVYDGRGKLIAASGDKTFQSSKEAHDDAKMST